MEHEFLVQRLVKTSQNVLEAFLGGWHPTFEQLERLEGALYPFVTEKVCGHPLLEECDCCSSTIEDCGSHAL